jgi:hypothetical protein
MDDDTVGKDALKKCLLLLALTCALAVVGLEAQEFRRGDTNCDGLVNEADAVVIADIALSVAATADCGLDAPATSCCLDAADTDDDGDIDLDDQILLLQYLLESGAPPPPPGPTSCGPDATTGDPLNCFAYPVDVCLTGPIGGNHQTAGDCNQDGAVDLSDALCLLGYIFLGSPEQLPCGDGTSDAPENLALLDWSGDGALDLSEPVGQLAWLFSGGSAHPAFVGNNTCIPIAGCPNICDPSAEPVVLRHGTFNTSQHDVNGRVEQLSNRTIRLLNFDYEPGFPAPPRCVVVWLHQDLIAVREEHGAIGVSPDFHDVRFDAKNLVFPIPPDFDEEDPDVFGYVSIWCTTSHANFGWAKLFLGPFP